MGYESLRKIFYVNNERHQEIYRQRFISPSARHLGFDIQQFNYTKSFNAFYNYPEELVLLLENIYEQQKRLVNIINSLPPLVIHQFGLNCLIDEVQATSAIEGIHSTRRELQDILEGKKSVHFSSIIKKYDALVSNEHINFETCQDIRYFYDNFAHEDIIANNPRNKLDGEIFRRDSVDVMNSSGKVLHRGMEP